MRIKQAYLSGACFAGLMLASSAALATPTFTLSGSSLAGHSGATDLVATDISALTNATVHDLGGGNQQENGYAIIDSLSKNGVAVNGIPGQMDLLDGNLGGLGNFYKLYITFQANVTGVG